MHELIFRAIIALLWLVVLVFGKKSPKGAYVTQEALISNEKAGSCCSQMAMGKLSEGKKNSCFIDIY
jgi:hypothetical protein